MKTLVSYEIGNLKKDIIAGIIVALVSIPISIGYALIAGLPPVYGLYGSWLPIVVYGMLTSSPRFVFGVDAAPAALVGGLLYSLGISYQSEEALAVVPLVALISGCWLIAFRVLNVTRFVKFISSPVMGGFITGIGCTIILMQVPKLYGGDAGRGELLELAEHLISTLRSGVSLLSLALGIGTIVIILIFRKIAPRIPMTVIMMAAGALMTVIFHVDRYGVRLLPAVEPGLPALNLYKLADGAQILTEQDSMRQVILTSLTIALVILAETLLATRNIGQKYSDRIDNNREVIAYAAGNITAALFGCCPVNGSVSRTGIADQFGVRSQMMSVSASITMMLILLLGTGFIQYLPVPVLTAIVISALIGILEFDLARHLRHADRTECWIFYAVMFTVLIFGTIYGVLAGIILSFVTVIIRMSVTPGTRVGYHAGRDDFYPADRMRDAREIEGAVIYHFGGAIFFANIDRLQDALSDAVSGDTRVLILEAGSVSSIDVTAAARLRNIADEYKRKGIRFYMCEHSGAVNDQLREFGAEELISSGVVRQHIASALADAGIRKPYDLVQAEGSETASVTSASTHIAEFEWAYGAEADAKMEEFAELLAQRMLEDISDDADAAEEMIDAAEIREFGSEFDPEDEDHMLDILERKIDRIGQRRHISPEHIHRIEDRVAARHRRLAVRLESRRRKEQESE